MKRTLRADAEGEAREPLRVGALWRIVLVAAFIVFAMALRAAHRLVNAEVIWILALQLAVGIVIALVRASHPPQRRDSWFLTITLCIDVLFVTALCVYVGGGLWMTTAFYMLATVYGSSQLPRRKATLVGLFGVAAFTAIVVAEWRGWVETAPFMGLPSPRGHGWMALLLTVTNAIALLAAIAMQQTLIRVRERMEGRTRLILESASDMILTLDREGRFVTWNPVVERETGYSGAELSNASWTRFMHRRDLYRWRFAFERGMLGEAGRVEARYRRRDGTRRWVSVAVTPVQEEGELVQILAVCRDVTDFRHADADRHRLQAQLAQSQKMQAVGKLVSGVAHELNNPLAAILNFTEEMLVEERTDDDREALEIVHQQAHRARAIVRDLLTFVRHRDDEDLGRPRERLDPAPVLESIGRSQRGEIERMGASLHLDTAIGMGLVEIDRAGLEQVVTNLLVNALQAVRRGGNVWLSGSRVGKRYLIVVEDDGPGIPESVLPHIFDPFFTTKPTGEGTGLGLSVSLGIVEQHGGSLRASNLSDDDVRIPGVQRRPRGARFVIELPIAAPNSSVEARPQPGVSGDPPAAPVGSRSAPGQPDAGDEMDRSAAPSEPHDFSDRYAGARHDPAAGPAAAGASARVAATVTRVTPTSGTGGCRVLIIDDEDSIRRVVRRYLERRGCVVEDAADGAAGLARLLDRSRAGFDLVLCDLNMPRLSGIALHERLRREAPELTAALVFSTGDTVAPSSSEFLSHTDRPVLEKPFELSKLGALLDECLSARG